MAKRYHVGLTSEEQERLRNLISAWLSQLTYRESLRDIEAILRAAHTKLYHMGIRAEVSLETLWPTPIPFAIGASFGALSIGCVMTGLIGDDLACVANWVKRRARGLRCR